MDEANNKLVKSTESFDKVGLPNDPSQQLLYLNELAKSGNSGITTTGDALMIVSIARELGIGLGAALRNVNVIKTKGGQKIEINYHIFKGQIERYSHVIQYERSYSYGPVYVCFTADGLNIREDQLPNNAVIVPRTELKNQPNDNNLYVAVMPEIGKDGKPTTQPKIIDYKVEYTFYRKYPKLDGTGFKIRTHKEVFYYSQAHKRGLYREGGPWQTMPEVMCDKTCFASGARHIASDLVLGMYIPEEMVIFTTNEDKVQTVEAEEI